MKSVIPVITALAVLGLSWTIWPRATPRPDVRPVSTAASHARPVATRAGRVTLAEETLFRGYLILRLRPLLASMPAAIIVSSFIFSLGHGYEGTSGVITVGVMGAVLALIYVWRKSLVAPVVIHFLQDLLAIVLLPLLAGH